MLVVDSLVDPGGQGDALRDAETWNSGPPFPTRGG